VERCFNAAIEAGKWTEADQSFNPTPHARI
jgi:hypothetical protein